MIKERLESFAAVNQYPVLPRLYVAHSFVVKKEKPMHRRHLLNLFVISGALLLLVSFHPAYGQLRIVGSISGTVQDPTGAVVPNARVVLKDQQTGLTRESMTTDGGTFLFPDLASGTYQATVSLTGFKTELVPKI